jgi:phosphoribosyl-dephospho-CoA transferase
MDCAAQSPRPHDLLFVRRFDAFAPCDRAAGLPDWLDAAWLARAPLVVRRAAVDAGRAPAGARGLARNQRCAGQVLLAGVARRVTPEALARRVLAGVDANAGRLAHAASTLPCIAALLALAPRLHELGLEWGPAGGAGFWLASGLPVLRPDSDLDLLVRVPRPPARATLAALSALQDAAPCRIDVQFDTGIGGFALNEYLRERERERGGKVLLKTAGGPLLVADPWDAPSVRAAA